MIKYLNFTIVIVVCSCKPPSQGGGIKDLHDVDQYMKQKGYFFVSDCKSSGLIGKDTVWIKVTLSKNEFKDLDTNQYANQMSTNVSAEMVAKNQLHALLKIDPIKHGDWINRNYILIESYTGDRRSLAVYRHREELVLMYCFGKQ